MSFEVGYRTWEERQEPNPNQCPWCVYRHPVAQMVTDHRAKCPNRPKEEERADG